MEELVFEAFSAATNLIPVAGTLLSGFFSILADLGEPASLLPGIQ